MTGTPPAANLESLNAALLAQRLATHRANLPWAVGGAFITGLVFVLLLWGSQQHALLAVWLGMLVGVLGLRAAVGLGQARAAKPLSVDRQRSWLRWYRLGFVAHGLVWGLAALIPLPDRSPLYLSMMLVVLTGITASSFNLTAFDLRAALCFGVPTLGLMSLRLFAQPEPLFNLLGVAALASLFFLGMTARRASAVVRDNVALQLSATQQAAALVDKHRFITLLVETTREGFWFVDADAITTDANPAMCSILGQPREALIGRSIFDFVDEANRAIFEREIARRAQGLPGGYEIALRRADGSLVDCFNHATPIVDAQGRRIGSIGMWTDISERKRAERQLQVASAQLREKSQALQNTLDSISQGIASQDAQGVLQVHNRRLLELLDLPPDFVRPGMHYQEAVDFLQRRGDLLPEGGYVDADGRRQQMPADRRDGPEVYVRRGPGGRLLEVQSRRLPDGTEVRTFADVTAYIEAQRALRVNEQELRALLDAFPGLIAVADADLRYTYVNARFAALIGRPADGIVGQSLRDVLGETAFARVADAIERTRHGEVVTTESEYPATAFRPRTVLEVNHTQGAPDTAGRRKVYAFGIDVSARKHAEDAMIAARDEAQRANQAKSQFLASMSHELRTPLNAILGFGHLLLTDSAAPLNERQQRQMGEILGGARHLLQLINEVLDLAAVETGRVALVLGPVPLAPLLEDCLGLLRPLADSGGVHLTLAEPPPRKLALLADPVRLKQVLLNLLGNAIKYNHRGGLVQVSCRPVGTRLRITISDTGPGLSAAQQARLFGAFERLEADRGQVEGSGLGLALSRGLMLAMQGQIGVDSQPGQGSRFWIELPPAAPVADDGPAATVQPPLAPAATAALPRPGARRHLVLYIEDNPINLMLMEALFDRLPHCRLVTASLPEPGLQQAREQRPDLVLLDIQLPGIDGFEVLRRLRADETTRDIPVIAVSANAMASAIERARHAGFARYLTKPLDFDLLRQAIDEALPAAADGSA